MEAHVVRLSRPLMSMKIKITQSGVLPEQADL